MLYFIELVIWFRFNLKINWRMFPLSPILNVVINSLKHHDLSCTELIVFLKLLLPLMFAQEINKVNLALHETFLILKCFKIGVWDSFPALF